MPLLDSSPVIGDSVPDMVTGSDTDSDHDALAMTILAVRALADATNISCSCLTAFWMCLQAGR